MIPCAFLSLPERCNTANTFLAHKVLFQHKVDRAKKSVIDDEESC